VQVVSGASDGRRQGRAGDCGIGFCRRRMFRPLFYVDWEPTGWRWPDEAGGSDRLSIAPDG